MAEARARKATTEELEEVNSGWVFDYRMDEDQLETIYTDRLVSKANRLRVPVPAKPWDTEDHEDENWMESQYGGWILKPEGFRKVRAEIRAELKARSERRQAWLTPLTGLIGALTGLVPRSAAAVIHKHAGKRHYQIPLAYSEPLHPVTKHRSRSSTDTSGASVCSRRRRWSCSEG